MPDNFVDHEARGAARGVKQLIESHEVLDQQRFAQLHQQTEAMREAQDLLSAKTDGNYNSLNGKIDAMNYSLNQKMDGVRAEIGSRPSWTVSTIISFLVFVIGILAARAWPG